MSDAPDQRLLEVLLDSWDRNNTILLNLLRALPEGGLEVKAIESSPRQHTVQTQPIKRLSACSSPLPQAANSPLMSPERSTVMLVAILP